MTTPIPLREQIAAVERAEASTRNLTKQIPAVRHAVVLAEADALAAALATLRGLLLIEETR